MNVRYRVELSQAERDELTAMLGGGKHAARKLKRAQILLAVDRGRSDEEIARTVSVSLSTVGRTKRRYSVQTTGTSSLVTVASSPSNSFASASLSLAQTGLRNRSAASPSAIETTA